MSVPIIAAGVTLRMLQARNYYFPQPKKKDDKNDYWEVMDYDDQDEAEWNTFTKIICGALIIAGVILVAWVAALSLAVNALYP